MRLIFGYLHLTFVLLAIVGLNASDKKYRLNQNNQKACNDKSKYQMPSEGPFLELPSDASHLLALLSGLQEWAKEFYKQVCFHFFLATIF